MQTSKRLRIRREIASHLKFAESLVPLNHSDTVCHFATSLEVVGSANFSSSGLSLASKITMMMNLVGVEAVGQCASYLRSEK